MKLFDHSCCFFQLDAVKVNPSYNQFVPDVNQGFLPISPYYKNDNPHYNLPIIRPAPIQKSNFNIFFLNTILLFVSSDFGKTQNYLYL